MKDFVAKRETVLYSIKLTTQKIFELENKSEPEKWRLQLERNTLKRLSEVLAYYYRSSETLQ